MSKVKLLLHIVFNTLSRKMTISEEHCDDLYRYIWHYFNENKCVVYRINGVENHVHILLDMHPTLSLSTLIGKLKHDSSMWMTASGLFPYFEGWGREYGAFSVSPTAKDNVVNYIIHQKEHHKRVNYEDEYRRLCEMSGVAFLDDDLT